MTAFFPLWSPLRDLGLGIPLRVSSLCREQSLYYKQGRRFRMEGLVFRPLFFARLRHRIHIMLAWIHRWHSQSHHLAPPSFHRSSVGSIDKTLSVQNDLPTKVKPHDVKKKQINSDFPFLVVLVVSFRFSLQHVSLRGFFMIVEGLSIASMFTSIWGVKQPQVDSMLHQLIVWRLAFKSVKWKLQTTALSNRFCVAKTYFCSLCVE